MNQNKKELEIGGISFGLTSGVITTLGMIVGMESATGSKLAIIAGIITIAVADSLSDALGMHLSEESRKDETNKPIWTISIFTFLGKLFFSLIFLIPITFLPIHLGIKASIFLGLVLIFLLAIFIAKRKKESIFKTSLEHISLTLLVILVSFYAGKITDLWK